MKAPLWITLAALLAACGGSSAPTNPAATPEGRLCGRAYGSTMDSLSKLYTQAGATLPDTLPKREDYINKCVELGFTEDQIKCMDPKLEALDPDGCKTTLEAVKDKKDQLDQLFKDAFDAAEKKEDKPAEGEAAGEGGEAPAEGGEAPAEGGEAPAEAAPAE